MSFTPTPTGTRGSRLADRGKPPGPVMRWVTRRVNARIRRQGGRFQGMDVLFLTTIGRRTGQRRQTPVTWFTDGPDRWLVVAAFAGAARHPAWYYNLAAHPDQAWIDLPDRTVPVIATQLDDAERADVWPRIVQAQPRYGKYETKTDRQIPVIRLTAASAPTE